MTREEMAVQVEGMALLVSRDGEFTQAQEIIAELRKTCVTCQHFEPNGHCGAMGVFVLKDGSGFCYHWEAKP